MRLLAAVGLWAACFPLVTIGLDLAPHLAFAAARAAVAGLCLLVLGAVLGRRMPVGPGVWGWMVLVALGATSLGFLGMFHAAEFVSPGLATVIYNAQPLLAAILGHTLLRERLGARGKTGLFLGLVGIIAIAWPGLVPGGTGGYALGVGYLFLAAAGEAVGNVAMKRLPREADAMMAMGWQLLLGAVPLALGSVWTEDFSSVTWSPRFLGVLLVLSVFGTALPFWLWFAALKQVELNKANAFRFLLPLLGLMIGVAFFKERVSWLKGAGVVVTLLGVALVQREGSETEAADARTP